MADGKQGRPTKYKEEYDKLAYKMCLLGHTDVELAGFFEVNEDTIYEWKKQHQSFSESLKEGKEIADAKVVESLYRRATGYSHEEDKIFQYEGDPVVVPTTKHYAPETVAGIFWLKNRQPKKWRDKQNVELTGKDGGPIEYKESPAAALRVKLDKIACRGNGESTEE